MRRREPSPAPSENEADILDSLYTDDFETENCKNRAAAPEDMDFDFGGLLEATGGDGDDNGDEDEAFIALKQAASFRKSTNLKGKSVKKGGGFQAMGLNANLLKAITRKGYSVPTPIQRKTIPLIMDRKDVVGMARTGSGKTAAFVIPMIERLRAHSAKVGARAVIMSPSRELALQTLKVVKEFGRGTDLKTVLLVGGDSLEEQFASMTTNPDILIATPGRLLHLKVEMQLDLSSIRYVVFDEADRLFEMGFAAQLTELLHALPLSRQTMLFSATLPKTLVEFARAGLQDPSLVRLDADSKVSADLESAFFSVKGQEKEGALLHILNDVIGMPVGLPEGVTLDDDLESSKKRKRGHDRPLRKEKPTEKSTIIFAATKHHVEYLAALLRHAGFAVSYVYGALDQTARKIHVDDFRRGRTNIMVVTDVAARGIDIPNLANTINYDFCHQPKVWVHRVGRTARAGQRGWSYNLIRDTDAPYLLDLQLFLGRKMIVGQESEAPSYAEDVVVGSLQRARVESQVEWLTKVLDESADMAALRATAVKAEKQYYRTRTSASSESAKRARDIVTSAGWMQLHPLFGKEAGEQEQTRSDMLAAISGYKPQESIFEVGLQGKKGRTYEAAEIMKNMREKVGPRRTKSAPAADEVDDHIPATNGNDASSDDEDVFMDEPTMEADDADSDSEIEVTVSGEPTSKPTTYHDTEVYMSYLPAGTRSNRAAEERGYGVHSGTFLEAARDATMDLTNDESAKAFGLPARAKQRWDKKQGKYVNRANDEDGTKGARMIRGESGVKIAASFQSGRFDKWRKANRMGRMPGVGEMERSGLVRQAQMTMSGGPGKSDGPGGFRFKHKQEKAPKEADKFRDDYHVRKKRVAEAKDKRVGRFKDGEGSRREVKGADDIRKHRKVQEAKRKKNARPSRK